MHSRGGVRALAVASLAELLRTSAALVLSCTTRDPGGFVLAHAVCDLNDGRSEPALQDADLMRRLTAGDAQALAELYARHASRCWSLTKRLVRDRELTNDVVQEVFLTLWRTPHAYDESRGAFGPWLTALAHHKAVDAIRSEEGHRRRTHAAAGDPPTSSVDEVVADKLEGDRVRGALASLSRVQGEALVLAYFAGLTHREIAVQTRAPLGTVKTRVRLGLRNLRAALVTDSGARLDALSCELASTRVPRSRTSAEIRIAIGSE